MDPTFEVHGRFTPGDPSDPDGDLATLRTLQERGADLGKPTHFIHFLSFPDRESTWAAGRELAEDVGYDASGHAPEQEGDSWTLRAEREQVPTPGNVARMRELMTLVAGNHGGEYDGWEAAVER